MDEQQAFIDAIVREPDEDTHRLVYADWLEEHGRGSWARFIRDQIWTPVSPCRNVPLTALLQLEHLVGPLPHAVTRNVSGAGGATVTYPNGMEFWFRRGCVAEVHMPCSLFLEHAEAVFRRHPVTKVTLTDREPYYNGAGHAWFKRTRRRPSESVPDAAILDDELFLALSNWVPVYTTGKRWKPYASADLALAALSAACVRLGRKWAGLNAVTSSVLE